MDRLFKNIKFPKAAVGSAIFVYTLLAFLLDFYTGKSIHFYAFYFPSVIMAAWFLNRIWVYGFVLLVTVLWFLAQWEWHPTYGLFVFFWNGGIRLLTFFFVAWAITKIRRKTEELETASKELARSNLELELFAGKAAHDLQAPLATILGFTELLKEKYQGSGDEATKDFTEHIISGVKRMSVFIKALLNYARVKKTEAPASPLELGKIVKEVIDNFHFVILQKKAEITCDPLPAVAIDPGLAGLLFQNLIGNAMKYCEKEPHIHISAARKGKEWLFSIQDNGIGIPEGSRERVFIMFEKLATQQKYPGSGIGLATCQKIVEHYGGRIWVDSKPNGGSTFFFTLPELRAAGNG